MYHVDFLKLIQISEYFCIENLCKERLLDYGDIGAIITIYAVHLMTCFNTVKR